ncbi:MAG TPA: FtsX-like permease family protein, partial [Spirochaetia bacterium]|nr:FtsX-like permease family protein [Spirochaetia bacterium]
MMFFLKLAVLSIISHKRRSAVIALSILLSVLVMIFVRGMLGGLRTSFFENLLQGSGHIQVHASGWEGRLDPYSIAYVLHDPRGVIHTLRGDPFISSRLVDVERMIEFGALVVHGDRNVALAGQAVQRTTRFFASVRSNVRSGEFLPPGRSGIALSDTTARLLDVHLGDAVTVLVQDASGSPYYLVYPVTAVFSSGIQQTDESTFFISLEDAQNLLDLPDEVTELRIRLTSPGDATAVARRISFLFSDLKPSVQTWQQVQGGLITLINLGDIYAAVLDIIIVIVAATVITSSILMTIFQRIPTFGTLRAIGLRRSRLFWVLMEEGVVLGLLGSALGIVV